MEKDPQPNESKKPELEVAYKGVVISLTGYRLTKQQVLEIVDDEPPTAT
jgi:hypothetical protein